MRLLFAGGLVLLAGPSALLVVMHSNHDFYIWLVSGPPPFDQFGSGPFQLWFVIGLGAGGVLCLIAAASLRLREAGLRSGFPLLELLLGVPVALLFLAGLGLLIP